MSISDLANLCKQNSLEGFVAFEELLKRAANESFGSRPLDDFATLASL
jgi:hypothetical protein